MATTNSTGLAIIGGHRSPRQMLTAAALAADSMMELAATLGKSAVVDMGASKHFTFNFWQAAGLTAGVLPRVCDVTFIERAGAMGYEARAEAVHIETGAVVS